MRGRSHGRFHVGDRYRLHVGDGAHLWHGLKVGYGSHGHLWRIGVHVRP